jgi:hypothetical protein
MAPLLAFKAPFYILKRIRIQLLKIMQIRIRTSAYFCGLFFLPVFGSNPYPGRLTLKLLFMWRALAYRSPPSWLGRRMRGAGAGCPPPPASTPPRTPRRPKWLPCHRHSATWTSTGTVAPNLIHICDDTSEYLVGIQLDLA